VIWKLFGNTLVSNEVVSSNVQVIRYIGVLFDAFSELAKAPEPESIKKRSIGFIKPEKKQESREQLSQKNDAFFQMQRVVILKRT
jgi:hypothetical protein